ncbi:hypothetical protein LINPERHAP2_LOCUS112 [Linum perenne]
MCRQGPYICKPTPTTLRRKSQIGLKGTQSGRDLPAFS